MCSVSLYFVELTFFCIIMSPELEWLNSESVKQLEFKSDPILRKPCSIVDLGLDEFKHLFGKGVAAVAPSLLFKKQYAVNYFNRLRDLRPELMAKANSTWPSHKVLANGLKELTAVGLQEVVAVGTLIRPYVNRPSMIDDISKNYGVMTGGAPLHLLDPAEAKVSFLSEEDHIILEDPSYRVRLVGQGAWQKLSTGFVTAVRGRMLPPQGEAKVSGIFHVDEFLLPGVWVPRPLSPSTVGAKYVVFLQGWFLLVPKLFFLHLGLCVGSAHRDSFFVQPLAVQRLREMLLVGSGPLGRDVVRLVVCGNTLTEADGDMVRDGAESENSNPNGGQKQVREEPLDRADRFFAELAATGLPIDIVPGPLDPTNFALPQMPIHPVLFPRSAVFSNFRSTTNPYKCKIDDVGFLKFLVF